MAFLNHLRTYGIYFLLFFFFRTSLSLPFSAAFLRPFSGHCFAVMRGGSGAYAERIRLFPRYIPDPLRIVHG
ncbi:hypothetical protein SAMN05660226_00639 [Parapedobacter luteus]|uniref:Uncharacterized protein n=1 Tax=Parapedobacter luteus TaxID=623280 RepID=A0A1T5A6J2_9SPHI|nr:hypothetical protein SAMN05660226_00639 [Parapedobacter luteus]